MPVRRRIVPVARRRALLVIVLAAGLVSAGRAQAQGAAVPVVTTQGGRLEGVTEGGLRIFRGIPYAAPPVGLLRWRPPQTALPWPGVRPAVASGPACPQKVARQEPERSLRNTAQSEDCLTLNIWAPDRPDGATLPVMVWIHGGSFRFGSGSLPLYDGSALARRGVVVVTINYRLGLFGTFAHPALRSTDGPDGNYGLLDVIAALRWVKDNIAGFGGDPGAVTLFGESAGGASVAYLMASPLADGLFARAIIQSGGLSLPEYGRDQAAATALGIARQLGAADAASLRALPADALRDADTAPADTMPFIDGTVVRDRMRAAFEAGRVRHVPLLIGSNDAEAGFFGPSYWQDLPREAGPDIWARLQRSCFGYGAGGEDACAEQVASERFAGMNSRAMARGASNGAPVFAYRFAWVPPAARQAVRGAIHTAEIPYVFGQVAADPAADAVSRALSDQFAARWVTFARTGNPSLQPGDWPRFQAGLDERVLRAGLDGTAAVINPAEGLLDTIDAAALPPRP